MNRTTQTFDLHVVRAKVHTMPRFRGQGDEDHLELSARDDGGRRFWVRLPANRCLTTRGPVITAGDDVRLDAQVKGVSDDGRMTFLNFARVIGVHDAE